MTDSLRGCEFGYEEHDGSRYCFAHAGFRIAGVPHSWCDRAPAPDRQADVTHHDHSQCQPQPPTGDEYDANAILDAPAHYTSEAPL
jgi:hypothetical protein